MVLGYSECQNSDGKHVSPQITNQMVAACKDYITEKGIKRIWDFPPAVLCANIDVTLDLYQEYDDCFQVRNKSKLCSFFNML